MLDTKTDKDSRVETNAKILLQRLRSGSGPPVIHQRRAADHQSLSRSRFCLFEWGPKAIFARHSAGTHVHAVTGHGYSLLWYEGDSEFKQVPWRHGIMYLPPSWLLGLFDEPAIFKLRPEDLKNVIKVLHSPGPAM